MQTSGWVPEARGVSLHAECPLETAQLEDKALYLTSSYLGANPHFSFDSEDPYRGTPVGEPCTTHALSLIVPCISPHWHTCFTYSCDYVHCVWLLGSSV